MDQQGELFTYLTSQKTAQEYLLHCYRQRDITDAESKSYRNASTFIYLLDHGRKFYENGRNLDIFVQPVLYFYGMTHLLKACLLTKRPDYPESTTQLSHGATTRKRKKKDYTFMQDEVKVQQNGLFTYFSKHLYDIQPIPFEKVKMEQLFGYIPELEHLHRFSNIKKLVPVGSIESAFLCFSKELLDTYHLTEKAFIDRLVPLMPKIINFDMDQENIYIQLEKKMLPKKGPFFYHYLNQQLYFPISRDKLITISEVMIHYLLLYNLSMLCRYEAEWWGELLSLKPDLDFPLIVQFLKITVDKIPMLLEKELIDNLN